MMKTHSEQALSINAPWLISNMSFDEKSSRLDIRLDFERGSRFADEDGVLCPVHDTVDKTWRHLNFFQHECYLHARVPRIKRDDGKVKLITSEWSGKLSAVDTVGIDETSIARGHSYISLFVDLQQRRTIHVSEGKGSDSVSDFVEHLEKQNAEAEQQDSSQAQLSCIIDRRHELVLLAQRIDWQAVDEQLGATITSTVGNPALPTRLIAGLFYLQHDLACHPTSLTRWRKRLGEAGGKVQSTRYFFTPELQSCLQGALLANQWLCACQAVQTHESKYEKQAQTSQRNRARRAQMDIVSGKFGGLFN